jgi:hypothetical protein
MNSKVGNHTEKCLQAAFQGIADTSTTKLDEGDHHFEYRDVDLNRNQRSLLQII